MNTSDLAKSFLCFFAIALLFVCANAAPAQQDSPELSATASQQKKEREQRQELERKTRALLQDVVSSAGSLKLPENRVFVMTNAADLLWEFDEKRARNLYWEAINSLNLIAPQVRRSSQNLSQDEQVKIQQAYVTVFGLRRNLLRQVAQRDPQLALELLRATRQTPPESKSGFMYPGERLLEEVIARAMAERDPAFALQRAREILEKGITLELTILIRQLNEKDPVKASEFTGEVISKLRMTNVAIDMRSSTLAIHLLQYSRTPEATGLAATAKTLRLSDEQRRELAEIVTSAALNATANSHLLFRIREVVPEIQQFFPERLAALDQKVKVFNESLTQRQRDENTYTELIRGGTPEEIVRRAATQTERERLSLYLQAATIVTSRDNADSFRNVVSKEIKDEKEQQNILDLVDSQQINIAVHRKQLDELRQLLPKIRRKEERARAMVEMALLLKEKGEDAEAATLLDEAADLIKTDLKSETHTNALLTLLSAYAVIDPPKAFALAERTVDQANSQISLLLLVDRVIKSGVVKRSEIILNHPGMLPVDFLVFKYGKGVAALAAADFNRTKALAERFERNELRIMARLLIVKGILSPTSPSQTY